VNTRSRLVAVAASTLMIGALSPAATAHATESCVSGAEVRTEVHALVSSLTDDVKSKATRAELAAALVETLKTFRGTRADTTAERRALGQEVAALARQLKDAPNLVARKAIVLQIRALNEQRERGPFTDAERTALTAAVTALKQATVAKTDGGAEGRAVAAAFRALHAQFVCTPA
jgi:hypothetical protein